MAATLFLGEADTLSDLLARLEFAAEVYVDGDFCGTWAVDTGGGRRIPFHLIDTGTAWLHLAGEKAAALRPGDMVLFPHAANHIVSNQRRRPAAQRVNATPRGEGPVTHMVCGFFEFSNPASVPLLDALPPVVHIATRSMKSVDCDAGDAHLLVDRMLAELSARRPGYRAAIDQLAFLLFIAAIRQQVEAGQLQGGLLGALFDSRLGRALAAIHREPERGWTLVDIAAEARMSRSGFAQKFAAAVGLSPMKYLTLWRMNIAYGLLQRSEQSIAQIAENCGYDSEPAFRKAFKSVMGKPPGAVRNRGEKAVKD